MSTETEKRPSLINTPAFNSWFEGSKLRDSLGNPLVLYHGARPGTDITEFFSRHETDGIYFTPDPLYAEGFTNELFDDEAKAGAIFPVYLSIKNPKVVVADFDDDEWLDFIDRGLNRRRLIEEGFDGAILIEAATGVIDQVQAYYPHQVKSAIGNSGTFDPGVSDIRYSRQDPRYLFAGPQAETSDLVMLDKARELESNKTPAPFIFKETGWLRGPDGQWRYEITDHEARLKIGVPEALQDDAFDRVYREAEFEQDNQKIKAIYHRTEPDYIATWGHTKEEAARNLAHALAKRDFTGYRTVEDVQNEFVELGDILEHPRLFAAYPRLRDMLVHFDPNLNAGDKGEFSWGRGITVNANMSAGDILSTLLHEIQHSIQSAEGFARGGSPEERFTGNVKSMLKELSSEHRQLVDRWIFSNLDLIDGHQKASDLLTHGLMYQSARRLREYANRDRPSGVLRLIKAECSWAYHEMVRQHPGVRRKFDELDRNWMSLPKRHRQAARNLFLREQCSEAADLLDQIIPTETLKAFRSDERQLKGMVKALEREASRARQKLSPLRELEKVEKSANALKERHEYSTAFDIYRALAGEIEARNTQTRQIMTPEERRATPPELTADVKRADAIVVMRGRNGSTLEIPHQMANITPLGYLGQSSIGGNRLNKEEAEYWCRRLLGTWKGRPEVHVVNRVSDLPLALQKDIWKNRAVRDVRAAYWKDSIYVLAPRIHDRNQLEEVLLHEIIGHYGLRSLLGEHLESTLELIYRDMGSDPIAEQIKALYFGHPPFDAGNPDHRQLVAEELMAKLAESGGYRDLTEWERFEAETRNGLRQMGFQLPLEKADLLNILYGAEQVVRNGGLSLRSSDYIPQYQTPAFRKWFGQSQIVDDSGKPMVVYHGTGSDFSQFLPSEGGTLGGGMYFTGSPEKAAEFARHHALPEIVDSDDGGFDLIETGKAANIMPVYLKMENPINARDMPLTDGVAEVRAKGHDGIIFNDYFVVFEPEQIKSAVGNTGSFDPDNPDIRFLRTYHGSPHQFDKFSLSAIGSGEGAQAYGWGLYFASTKRLAQWYRDTLTEDHSEPQFYVDGEKVDPGNDTHLRTALYHASETGADAAYAECQKIADQIVAQGDALESDTIKTMKVLQSLRGRTVENRIGYLYQVSIPEDNQFLVWEQSLAEQPAHVIAAIKGSGILEKTGNEQWSVAAHMMDGNALYESVRQWFVNDEASWQELGKTPYDVTNVAQAASEYLNGIGIPGLRYLQAASRNADHGTLNYNYVVWDESVVSIEAVNDEIHQAQELANFSNGASIRYSRVAEPIGTWLDEYTEFRIRELTEQVELAYAEGNFKQAEQLDVELETMYECLEHYLLQADEDGVANLATPKGRQLSTSASWLNYAGSHEDAEAGLTDVLADTYSQFIDPACWLDREAAITNGRANIDNFGGATDNISDEQVLDAMKDAYEHSGQRLVTKRRTAREAFGVSCDAFLAMLAKESSGSHPVDDSMAKSTLDHMTDFELKSMLQEEAGIDASDLNRNNLVILAEQYGLHTIQNTLFKDLIHIALDRWSAGKDSASATLSLIEHHLSRGAYGYDELAVEQLRQQVKLQEAMSSHASNQSTYQSPEVSFRAFLNQELAHQESCLEVALHDRQRDAFTARREQKLYHCEIANLRSNLRMLDAGMTIEQIQMQARRADPSYNEHSKSEAHVLLIADHLKTQEAYQSAISPEGSDSDTPSDFHPS